MSSAIIQLLVLAGIALFLVLRLKNVLGTRDGFEPTATPKEEAKNESRNGFEVIEGGIDRDIADHVDINSDTGAAFQSIKAIEPDFSVTDFQAGARQAYEMILMSFEKGDIQSILPFLSKEVYESFATVVDDRTDKGLSVDATFVGVRELKILDAWIDPATSEAEIKMKFVAELTSVVKDADGQIVEGDPNVIKRQKDVWTFARKIGSNDPNWELVATGE